MKYPSPNQLGGNWTLRFLAYVQELDPKPRPGPQHNTSYYSLFLEVQADIEVRTRSSGVLYDRRYLGKDFRKSGYPG